MEIENENPNNNKWTPEYESLIKDIKKRRAEIKRKRDNPFSHIVMPMAMKVSAQTIGLDLVSVQPLSAPKGLTFYMDFQYGESKYDKRKRIIDKLLGKEEVKEDDTETHFTLPYGELSHPDNTNFTIEIKDETPQEAGIKTLSKWASIIESTKNNDKMNWLEDYMKIYQI